MTSWTYSGLTGIGWGEINGGAWVGVTDIYQAVSVSSPTLVKVTGSSPQQYRYAGLWGIGFSPTYDADGIGSIEMWHSIIFEREFILPPTVGGASQVFPVISYHWRLPDGVTLALTFEDT